MTGMNCSEGEGMAANRLADWLVGSVAGYLRLLLTLWTTNQPNQPTSQNQLNRSSSSNWMSERPLPSCPAAAILASTHGMESRRMQLPLSLRGGVPSPIHPKNSTIKNRAREKTEGTAAEPGEGTTKVEHTMESNQIGSCSAAAETIFAVVPSILSVVG